MSNAIPVGQALHPHSMDEKLPPAQSCVEFWNAPYIVRTPNIHSKEQCIRFLSDPKPKLADFSQWYCEMCNVF